MVANHILLEADGHHQHQRLTLQLPQPKPRAPPSATPAARAALAAAGGAGTGELLTTGLFFPIELVKCRLQAAISGGDGSSFEYTGLADGILCILREEGPQGLFTGLTSAASRSLSSELVTVYFGELLLHRHSERHGHVGNRMKILLRTIGGWISIALTLPVEAIATRVTTARPPVSVRDAVRQLWREGGCRAFWTGFRVSLLLCLNPALMLTAVDMLRALVFATLRLRRLRRQSSFERLSSEAEEPPEPEQMSMAQAFMVGAVAKLLTMCAVYPLVRGKVLMQARDIGGQTIFQVLASAVATGGFRSLYKGLGAQLSKSMLSASVKYAVKEHTEGALRQALSRRP